VRNLLARRFTAANDGNPPRGSSLGRASRPFQREDEAKPPTLLRLLVIVGMAAGLSTTAGAELVLSYTPGITDAAANSTFIELLVGETVEIPFYLVDTDRSAVSQLESVGLSTTGFRFVYSSASGITQVIAAVPGSGLTQLQALSQPGSFQHASAVLAFPPAPLEVRPSDQGRTHTIQIGTFTFQGVTPGEVDVSVARPVLVGTSIQTDGFLDGNRDLLDPLIFDSSPIPIATVRVIPEPNTGILLGGLAIGTLTVRRRRQEKPAKRKTCSQNDSNQGGASQCLSHLQRFLTLQLLPVRVLRAYSEPYPFQRE